jgi:hypothetical protein
MEPIEWKEIDGVMCWRNRPWQCWRPPWWPNWPSVESGPEPTNEIS